MMRVVPQIERKVVNAISEMMHWVNISISSSSQFASTCWRQMVDLYRLGEESLHYKLHLPLRYVSARNIEKSSYTERYVRLICKIF